MLALRIQGEMHATRMNNIYRYVINGKMKNQIGQKSTKKSHQLSPQNCRIYPALQQSKKDKPSKQPSRMEEQEG